MTLLDEHYEFRPFPTSFSNKNNNLTIHFGDDTNNANLSDKT